MAEGHEDTNGRRAMKARQRKGELLVELRLAWELAEVGWYQTGLAQLEALPSGEPAAELARSACGRGCADASAGSPPASQAEGRRGPRSPRARSTGSGSAWLTRPTSAAKPGDGPGGAGVCTRHNCARQRANVRSDVPPEQHPVELLPDLLTLHRELAGPAGACR